MGEVRCWTDGYQVTTPLHSPFDQLSELKFQIIKALLCQLNTTPKVSQIPVYDLFQLMIFLLIRVFRSYSSSVTTPLHSYHLQFLLWKLITSFSLLPSDLALPSFSLMHIFTLSFFQKFGLTQFIIQIIYYYIIYSCKLQ